MPAKNHGKEGNDKKGEA